MCNNLEEIGSGVQLMTQRYRMDGGYGCILLHAIHTFQYEKLCWLVNESVTSAYYCGLYGFGLIGC